VEKCPGKGTKRNISVIMLHCNALVIIFIFHTRARASDKYWLHNILIKKAQRKRLLLKCNRRYEDDIKNDLGERGYEYTDFIDRYLRVGSKGGIL
jgi:hypothetical protein